MSRLLRHQKSARTQPVARRLSSSSQVRPRVEKLEDRWVPAAPFVADEILVRFQPGLTETAIANLRSLTSATLERRMEAPASSLVAVGPSVYQDRGVLELLSLPAGVSVDDAIATLSSHPAIAVVEPNYILTAAGFPDDTSFGSLWGLHNTGQSGGLIDADIDAPEAWDITTGSADVVVFVIDSGVDYTHPDLAANMWVNPGEVAGNGVDDDNNGYIDDIHGINSITGSGDPMDDNGHGTHCAGTIGGTGNNALGVTGVNWSVKIGAAKFLSAGGSGSTADAIECFNYINDLKNRGINVVVTNNSWGGGGFSQTLMDAINGPVGMPKILHAAAAGNNNRDTDVTPFYPANYNLNHIISVAATDRNDRYASFSNWGTTQVDIAAPGVSILSTTQNNTYSFYSGTSMASPHVAGAAALIAAEHPTRTATQLKADLMLGADDIGGIGTNMLKPTITNSRLNIHQTLVNIVETDTTPPAAVSDLGVAAVGLSSVTLSWTSTGDDGVTGTAHNYDVRYSTSPITSANWASASPAIGEPRPQSSGATESFRVKGLQLGTTYYFAMKARDNLDNESALSNVISATTLATGAVVFSDGFETGLSQWTADSPWGRTNSVQRSGSYSVTDSPSGNYANNANVSLTSATINLTGMIDSQLSFWHRYDLESNWDFGYVEVSGNGGTTWTRLASYTGKVNTFQNATLDLSNYDGNANVKMRFRLQSDASMVKNGWFIDDVNLVAVGNPNQPPVAHSQSVNTAEDTAQAIVLTATDPESSPLTYTVVSAPSHGTLSGAAPNLTYTPHGNYHGSDSFTFRANDGTNNSNVATVSITVTPVNDAPVAQDQSIVVKENGQRDVALSATDVDGDALTYSLIDGPAHGTLSGTAPNVTYTPDSGYNGPDSFTFQANDGSENSNLATVSITVTPNTAPTADPQSVTLAEDSPTVITLTGSDAEGDPIAFGVIDGPSHGSLTGTAPNLTYHPAGNYFGSDSFTFQVNDGELDSLIVTVEIDVTPVNDAPVADPQSVNTNEDDDIAVTLTGSDIDGDALTYSIVSGPANGSLSGTAPNVTYTPNANFNGSDSFTFRVNDGTENSATATVSITIAPVDDPFTLFFSLDSSATVGGLSVADEDIVAWDGGASFTRFFDGSDVGVSGFTIDDFSVVSATQILMSFTASGSVPGISGTVERSDIVMFTATSLGETTTGTFSMYFDGSDVGLTGTAENVDAFGVLPNGDIVVSTSGSASVTGATGAGEDLLRFTPTSTGTNTAGTWAIYFDGSDVGLNSANENVDAVAVDASGKIYLSTTGSFSVSGLSGSDEDVFVFTPTSLGSNTSGTFANPLFFDGSAFGLSGGDVAGIDLPGNSGMGGQSVGSAGVTPPLSVEVIAYDGSAQTSRTRVQAVSTSVAKKERTVWLQAIDLWMESSIRVDQNSRVFDFDFSTDATDRDQSELLPAKKWIV